MLSIAGNRPRIAFWGTGGAFSQPVLNALIAADCDVGAVVMPAPAPSTPIRLHVSQHVSLLPIVNPFRDRGVAQLAWEHGIRTWVVGDVQDRSVAGSVRAWLDDQRLDAVCVACWNRRIPAALLDLPPLGWLNVHPSLLPMYRGPAPLFHALRDDAPHGVTIHRMSAALDRGPILCQTPIALPDGASSMEIDRRCGEVGGQLLVESLMGLIAATIEPQPQVGSFSHAPWPTADHFTFDRLWSARRAFNFMRGTDEWNTPYRIVVDGAEYRLSSAIAFDASALLPAPVVRTAGTLAIQFAPGVLQATCD